ncbi:MAG: hypothetical protein OXG81_07815 [Acidobacteria bacterium]|nr:hypothetical protein [Acidobacteriota bacterium]
MAESEQRHDRPQQTPVSPALNVKLERQGSVVVTVPIGKTPPPLTTSDVAAVIEEIRTRRDRP